MAPTAYAELRNLLAQIHDLGRARAVLAWDARTMMPPTAPKGASASGSVRARMKPRSERSASVSGASAKARFSVSLSGSTIRSRNRARWPCISRSRASS